MYTNTNLTDPHKIVVTKLQGGFPVNAPLATNPQTTLPIQDNSLPPIQQGQQGGVQSLPNSPLPIQSSSTTNFEDGSSSNGSSSDGLSSDGSSSDDASSDGSSSDGSSSDNENEGKFGGSMKDSDTVSSVSTTELLGRDPLYLVLSNFLANEEGENVVDVLSKLNRNLAKLINVLDKDHKKNKDRKSDTTKSSQLTSKHTSKISPKHHRKS
jgi:hypothetical protein